MKNSRKLQILGLAMNITGLSLLIMASLGLLKIISLDNSGFILALAGIFLATCGYLITLFGFNSDIMKAISTKIKNKAIYASDNGMTF
jgi:hypothetical protein